MRIGVDLGGTKIEIAALGPGGKILLRERESSHVGSYDATIRAVKGLVEAAEAKLGRIATVGIGTPGAIAVEGRVLTGANAIAGEWGHNPMPWPKPEWGEVPGPPCYGAQPGCIEVYLSGPGLASDHARVTGEKREPGDIERAAAAGEAPARATMARYHDRFARALAHVINLLDPDVIVIGGGLSNINAIYTEVPPRMQPYVFSDVCTTPVVKNKHGDSGGVRGAAWLWREDEAPD